MTKVAIYVRVSTIRQDTDRQISELQEFAANNHFEVHKIYEEQVSGFKGEEQRPDFIKLKQDAEAKLFNIILFSEFTRLARRISEINKQIEFFQSIGIELFFQKQNIWVRQKNDFATQLVTQMFAIMATYEAELFAERSISGKIERLRTKTSTHIGGTAISYGYQVIDKELVIDETEGEIVKTIFNMYNDNFSVNDISNFLIQNNVETKTKSGNWFNSFIYSILKNEIYIGKRIIIMHEPLLEKPSDKQELKKKLKERKIIETIEKQDETLRIVSDNLFKSVQDKLYNNKINKNRLFKYNTLIRHLIKCGNCNGNYIAKNEGTIPNIIKKYMCLKSSSNNLKIDENRCINPALLQSKLDGIIIAASINFLLMDKDTSENESNKSKWEKELNTINTKILIKQQTIENAKIAIEKYAQTFSMSSYITADMFQRFSMNKELEIKHLEKETQILIQEKKVAEMRLKALNKKKVVIEDYNSLSLNDERYQYYYNPENFIEVKKLIEELIEKIIITGIENNKTLITIYYKNGYVESIFTSQKKHKKTDYYDTDNKGREFNKVIYTPHEIKRLDNNKLLFKEIEHTCDELIDILTNPDYGAYTLAYTKYTHL